MNDPDAEAWLLTGNPEEVMLKRLHPIFYPIFLDSKQRLKGVFGDQADSRTEMILMAIEKARNTAGFVPEIRHGQHIRPPVKWSLTYVDNSRRPVHQEGISPPLMVDYDQTVKVGDVTIGEPITNVFLIDDSLRGTLAGIEARVMTLRCSKHSSNNNADIELTDKGLEQFGLTSEIVKSLRYGGRVESEGQFIYVSPSFTEINFLSNPIASVFLGVPIGPIYSYEMNQMLEKIGERVNYFSRK